MMSAGSPRPLRILLVEDNRGDVRLTEEALKRSEMPVELSVVENGLEAMAFLRAEGGYASVSRPDLILLDLDMPEMDGRQVLEEIKFDEDLRRIPVAMLTASTAEQDILRSYNLHVHSYITKPVDIDQVISVARDIENFWRSIVKPPKHRQQAVTPASVEDQSADDHEQADEKCGVQSGEAPLPGV